MIYMRGILRLTMIYVLEALSYLKITNTYRPKYLWSNFQFSSPTHVQIMYSNKINFKKDQTRFVYYARSAQAQGPKPENRCCVYNLHIYVTEER
jgi:DNA-binding transcriptional regulator WhiA